MKFPDFIIIGATKCGTTSLWYNLDKHPKINMATPTEHKIEMLFWKRTRWKLGIDWYKSRFEGEISGEKTAGYSLLRKSMSSMSQYIPDVKLLLCIRNPVDRAFSNYLMNKKSRIAPQTYNYDLLKNRYFGSGMYINHIEKNILPFFDSSQLKICILEYMKKDLTVEMKNIFKFIGVDDLDYKPQKVKTPLVRPGRTRKQDIRLSRQEKFYRVWATSNEKLDESIRSEGLKFFKPYNERLFNYLGYEIEEWNT